MTLQQLIEKIKTGELNETQIAIELSHYYDCGKITEKEFKGIPGKYLGEKAQHLLSTHGPKPSEQKVISAEEFDQEYYSKKACDVIRKCFDETLNIKHPMLGFPNWNDDNILLNEFMTEWTWYMTACKDIFDNKEYSNQQNNSLKAKVDELIKTSDRLFKEKQDQTISIREQQKEIESLKQRCERMFSKEDMEKCFEAGVKFERNIFDNPSNTEYIMLITEDKTKGE